MNAIGAGRRCVGPALFATAATLAGASLAGCGEPRFAPNVLKPDDQPPPVTKPAWGPWFVDRATGFGLGVVTRCGHPEKRMALDSLGVGLAIWDYDGDGDLDLFVCGGSEVREGQARSAGGPWLFRNDGPGRWVDVTSSSGLSWTGWAQGAAVADYDGDGDLDLFIAQHGRDTLWRNQGDGTFRDQTLAAGIFDTDETWGVSAAWGDADGDGDLDLFVVNYLQIDPLHPPRPVDYLPGHPVFAGPSMLAGQSNTLWRNRGDGTFEDTTASAGLDRPKRKGMAALFADLDDDGRPDLFVTNDTQANDLFWNEGAGRFVEGGLAAGIAVDPYGQPEGSMAADLADMDGDGRLDLAYTNFRHEGTRLFLNQGGRRFLDASNLMGAQLPTIEHVGWGLVLVDLDSDGWPDLVQADGHVYPSVPDSAYAQPPVLLRNKEGQGLQHVTASWGPKLLAMRSGRALASGDLDGDGDLDLVMTTIDGPLRVLINEGHRAGHAVSVRLEDGPPNTRALGAVVRLTAGGRTQVQMVRSGGGFLSSSDNALVFGLGPATTIDELAIHWPDGATSRYHDLRAEQRILVRRQTPDLTTEPFSTAQGSVP